MSDKNGRILAAALREASWIVANGGVVPCGYKELFDRTSDFLERSSDSPKPLAWTKERPTEPGWYFTRPIGDQGDKRCDFYDANDLSVSPTFYNTWEWAGPYPEPTEPNE